MHCFVVHSAYSIFLRADLAQGSPHSTRVVTELAYRFGDDRLFRLHSTETRPTGAPSSDVYEYNIIISEELSKPMSDLLGECNVSGLAVGVSNAITVGKPPKEAPIIPRDGKSHWLSIFRISFIYI